MSKKGRRKNGDVMNVVEELSKLINGLDEELRSKVKLMFEDFLEIRKQNREEYENDEKKQEAKIKQLYKKRQFELPSDVQQLKVGDILNAGGSIDIANGGYTFEIPRHLVKGDFQHFAMPAHIVALSAKKNRPGIPTPCGSTQKSNKRGAGILSPLNTSVKRKTARLASKPSQHALNFSQPLNTSSKAGRVLRSTVRKTTVSISHVKKQTPPEENAEEAMDIDGNVENVATAALPKAATHATPKNLLQKKQARKPTETEDVKIISANGTPLLIDNEWIKKRFNVAVSE